jgi:CheY-like chemotaxis protein
MPAQIIVVEDNKDNLTLVDYLLRAYGYEPLLARTGEEGLRIAIETHPDLMLLDIRMPGMDGYQVAAAIRNTPGLERTRVVALTASAMTGDRERIAAAGFDGYIQKPIDPETFLARLKPFLAEQSAGRNANAGER